MTVAVRYYTKTGNSKKLAEAIAPELGVKAESVEVPLPGHVDQLFLCNAVYAYGINDAVKRFVEENAGNIGEIVNVSSAALIQSTHKKMGKIAAAANVPLSSREFHCRGQFKNVHRGHPDEADLEAAREFARSFI